MFFGALVSLLGKHGVVIHDVNVTETGEVKIDIDFSEHDKVFEDKISELSKKLKHIWEIGESHQNIRIEVEAENKELKQRIAELESKETETCEKEPVLDDCRPSMEWYDNRHQSDCIEINRLNTTIDVLIHKVEYLRQFAGLE